MNEPKPPTLSAAASFDQLWSSYWLDVQAIGPLTFTRFRLMQCEIDRITRVPTRILDVGCGPGRFLSLLGSRFPQATLTGVEPSREAKEAAPAALRERILLGTLDVHLDALSELQPDLVVCSEVLEHVSDADAVMAHLVRLAAPGASFIFTVPAGRAHWSVQDEVAGHVCRFEAVEFELMLRRNGLDGIRLYTWGGPVSWAYNRLLNWVGPRQAAQRAHSRLGRTLARIVTAALHVDDLFKGDAHFQLIASARKSKSSSQ